MFDLFGYWASATVLTFLLLFPVFIIGFVLIKHLLAQVLEDKDAAINMLKPLVYVDYYDDVYFLLGKNNKPLVTIDASALVGIFAFMIPLLLIGIIGGTYDKTNADSFLHAFSIVNTALAPLFGSITIFALSYFGMIWSGRKIVRKAREVNTILAKVKDLDNESSNKD